MQKSKKTKKNKKKDNIKNIVKLAGAVVGILIFTMLVLLSPLFNISEIQVSGNKHYTKQEIIDVVNIDIEQNWFKEVSTHTKINLKNLLIFRYLEAENNIKSFCPYVKDAKVSLCGLGKCKIDIVERKEVFLIPYLGSYIIADEDGMAINVIENIGDREIPKLKGVRVNSIEIGKIVNTKDNVINECLKVYNLIKKSDSVNKYSLYNHIDYIDLSNLNNLRFFLDNRILIILGDINELTEYKINFLKEIFFTKLNNDEKGTLYFVKEKNPTFVSEIED